jgi:hypothetical protein
VWNTSGLMVGDHALTFSIQPLGITWTHTVTLQSASNLPLPEPNAHWSSDESDSCLVYYITNTASGRDIQTLLEVCDEQAGDVSERLGIEFAQPVLVTLVPRVLGHGGFAKGEIYISYLDRNYAGSGVDMVMHHEMVHILDAQLGGDLRPRIFVEGVAVYLTGGHFKPEPLLPRAAVLLSPELRQDGFGLDEYLPLIPLADDFYNAQHEIGYLQAGALVEYMVDTWGWQAFSDFYRSIPENSNGEQSNSIDKALQTHFHISLTQLEDRFIDALLQQPVTQELYDDVRLTVAFYDTVRRYQHLFDPSAYFLTAWIPDGPDLRERDIVADYVRHPAAVENIALETLLASAEQNLRSGFYSAAEERVLAINSVLDAIEALVDQPFAISSLARDYYSVVSVLWESGYQVEQIFLDGDVARVEISNGLANVRQVELENSETGWSMVGAEETQ